MRNQPKEANTRKHRRKKPGPKKGSKWTPTREGLPIFENRRRAVWGDLDGKPGAGIGHQLWMSAHPAKSLLALNDCSQQKEIERYIDASIDGALKGFAIEAKARIKAGDGQFFSVFGETIRRLSEGELPVNPQRAAILAYAEVILGQKPDHRFTAAELQDKVPWPPKSGYTARPEERQLRRLMDELQIPQ